MSRCKVKQLKTLIVEANILLDAMQRENKELKKRVSELEESSESFIEVEENLHKQIAALEKPNGIKQRLINFFS